MTCVVEALWLLSRRLVVLAVFISLLTPLACKRNAVKREDDSAARALPIDPEVSLKRLDNGFTYLLKPAQHSRKVVELALVTRTGSVLERDDERGFAHFVEHVAFDQRFGDLTFEALAGQLGTSTGPDTNGVTRSSSTVYRLAVPAANPELLARALDLLRGVASTARFDEETVERQRGIVRSEQRLRADPLRVARWRHLFQGSILADREPGGTEAAIEAASPQQLEAFYRRWYRPEQLAIVAVGQFERGLLSELIAERFAGLPRTQAEPVPRLELQLGPAQEFTSLEAASLGLQQGSVELISRLPAPRQERERDFSLQLLDRCLASLLDSRFDRVWMAQLSRLADRPQHDVGSESSEGQLNALRIRLVAQPGQLRGAAEVLLVELERVRQHGFSEDEVRHAVAEVSRWLKQVAAQATLVSEVDRLTRHFLVGGELMSPEQTEAVGQRLLGKLAPSLLHARLTEWLATGRRSLLALRAAEDAPLSSDDLQAMAREVATRKLEPLREDGPRALMAALPEPGLIIASEEMLGVGARVWTLGNGARVVFKPARPGSNEVLLRAVSPGGRAHSPPSRYANARLADSVVLDSGVGDHDIQSLVRFLEGKRATVRPWLSAGFEGLRGSSPTDEVELMLQLAHLYVTRPRADAHALERYRASLRAPPDASGAFGRAITAALHPGDPRFTKPDPDTLALDELLHFYRDRFGNVSDFTFVIVGDLSEQQLQPLVERYLASMPGSPRADRLAPSRQDRRPAVTRVRLAGRAGGDSEIRLEFHGPATPNGTARVEVEALRVQLESELLRALRQERGAVYAPLVTASWSTDGYELTIGFNCSPEDVEPTREATWAVIDNLTREPLPASTVEALRATLAEQYTNATRVNQFWADQLAEAYMFGTPPQDILELPELSALITAEGLTHAARRYLRRDDYVDAVWSPG